MGLPYILVVVVLVLGLFFYRTAEFEQRSGLLWAAISIAFSFVSHTILGWGYVGLIGSQVLLFGAMFVANLVHDRRVH